MMEADQQVIGHRQKQEHRHRRADRQPERYLAGCRVLHRDRVVAQERGGDRQGQAAPASARLRRPAPSPRTR